MVCGISWCSKTPDTVSQSQDLCVPAVLLGWVRLTSFQISRYFLIVQFVVLKTFVIAKIHLIVLFSPKIFRGAPPPDSCIQGAPPPSPPDSCIQGAPPPSPLPGARPLASVTWLSLPWLKSLATWLDRMYSRIYLPLKWGSSTGERWRSAGERRGGWIVSPLPNNMNIIVADAFIPMVVKYQLEVLTADLVLRDITKLRSLC